MIGMNGNSMFAKSFEEEPEADNRRRHERRNINWNVAGQWANKTKFTARTSNVSRSGFLMHTAREFKVGDKGYVKIDTYSFGRHRIIDGIFEVKHAAICNNQFNCGVLFINISDRNKTFLNAFVNGDNPHIELVKPKPKGFPEDDDSQDIVIV